MVKNKFSFKHERKSYHGFDMVIVFEAVEHEKTIRVSKRSSPFKPVLIRYPSFKLSTVQRHYKKWVDLGRPKTYVIQDQRKNNVKRKSLPDHIEDSIKNQIIKMNEEENDLAW